MLRAMGRLDEAAFTELVRGCPACGAAALEIASYLDRRVDVMLGDPNDDGRWAHDGEKFIDGVYRVTCTACGRALLDAPECPRCHAPGGLAAALAAPTRAMPPKRCPTCRATELVVDALVPAVVAYTGGRPPPPRPLASLGDAGYHVVAITCDACGPLHDADGCPLCLAPGPLRERP
jgi:hypothetical protein